MSGLLGARTHFFNEEFGSETYSRVEKPTRCSYLCFQNSFPHSLPADPDEVLLRQIQLGLLAELVLSSLMIALCVN